MCMRLFAGGSRRSCLRRCFAIGEALRACASELGLYDWSAPSEANYVRWRRASAGRGAPSPGAIRRAGAGSWSKGCALALGLPLADPLHQRRMVGRRGTPYPREAVLAALRSFSGDLAAGESPTAWRYCEWSAGLDRSSVAARGVPLTIRPMERMFGSWPAALEAAGVDLQNRSLRRRARARATSTASDVERALRLAAEVLGPPLTVHRYDAWASRLRAERSNDPDCDYAPNFPSSTAIARRLGGWRAAVATVLGLDYPVARAHSREYLDQDLKQMWSGFLKFAGERTTEQMWDAYREQTRDAAGSYAVASASTLMRRLGSGTWRGVCRHFGESGVLAPGWRRRYTTEDLVAAWTDCKRALGRVPRSPYDYESWRRCGVTLRIRRPRRRWRAGSGVIRGDDCGRISRENRFPREARAFVTRSTTSEGPGAQRRGSRAGHPPSSITPGTERLTGPRNLAQVEHRT
jgi:hypothetical protein